MKCMLIWRYIIDLIFNSVFIIEFNPFRSLEYQGIQPPVNRSEDNFDPGSKYHIVAGVPYIRWAKRSIKIRFKKITLLAILFYRLKPKLTSVNLTSVNLAFVQNCLGEFDLAWFDPHQPQLIQSNLI